MMFDKCGDCKQHDPVRCQCRNDGSTKIAADTACGDYDPRIVIKSTSEIKKIDPFFGTPIGNKK